MSNPRCIPAACSLLTSTLLAFGSSHAEQLPWSVRVGPANVQFKEASNVEVAGSPFPGGQVSVSNNSTIGLEFGYALTSRWTARMALGVPPTTTLTAGGSLAALVPPLTGTLGHVKYAPAMLTTTYQLGEWASLRPYAGAGVAYTWVISSKDADIGNLRVKSAWGTVLQAGVDVPLSRDWSVFLDLRKLYVKTKASGSIAAVGGAPAAASVTLNPLITLVGVGFRF